MKARIVMAVVIGAGLLAPTGEAQFIGDALAAAGIAASEQQAVSAMGSMRGATVPKAGGSMSSAPAQGANVYEPSALGKDVGLKPGGAGGTSGTPAGAGAPTSTGSRSGATSPTQINQPQVGGSTGFAGARLQAESIDPAALASWQAAMRPVGTKVSSLSSSAEDVSWNGKTYQYDMGVFYEKKGGSWIAVAAPPGASIKSKPLGASTVFANGKPHIYYYGTFYIYDGAKRAYVVVAPPSGATIDYLPDTAKKVDWNGSVHYEYAGTHYKPYYRGSALVFVVAG